MEFNKQDVNTSFYVVVATCALYNATNCIMCKPTWDYYLLTYCWCRMFSAMPCHVSIKICLRNLLNIQIFYKKKKKTQNRFFLPKKIFFFLKMHLNVSLKSWRCHGSIVCMYITHWIYVHSIRIINQKYEKLVVEVNRKSKV